MESKLLSASYANLIDFIPESKKSHLDSNKKKSKKLNSLQDGNCFIDKKSVGEDIKSFYENLLSDKSSENYSESISKTEQITKSTVKRKTKSRRRSHHPVNSTSSLEQNFFQNSSLCPNQRQNFKLLKCSQLGDERTVEELLSNKTVNVNFKDFYGWTALMCAAKEGHSNVMESLLRHGADQTCVNSSGDTAFSLAVNAGHAEVALFLQSWNSRRKDTTRERQDSHDLLPSREVFHCDICKQDFSQQEASSHKTSTVHLFNGGFLAKSPTYFIPDSNRGFQMMLRSGWDSGKGLGPDGKGLKFPVKTVFKQNRVGLGGEDAKRNKAKVTHFGKNDRDAVKTHKENPLRQVSVRKAARIAAKSKERKEKRWEKNLRFEMG